MTKIVNLWMYIEVVDEDDQGGDIGLPVKLWSSECGVPLETALKDLNQIAKAHSVAYGFDAGEIRRVLAEVARELWGLEFGDED